MSENRDSEIDVVRQISPLIARLSRDDLIALAAPLSEKFHEIRALGPFTEVFKTFELAGLHVLFPHFYSIVPEVTKIPGYIWEGPWMQSAFNTIRSADTAAILDEVLSFVSELREIPQESEAQLSSAEDSSFCWHNGSFPPLDAITYYGLIRSRKPKRILEVGAGNSTKLALLAAAANSSTRISVIEPYPIESLKALRPHLEHVVFKKIEDAPLWLFDMLDPGDVLFIDTSHVLNVGSEVNYIMFNVLPRLRPGVMVHIHDIFLPYEYPRWWLEEGGVMWNEQYAWLAFLMSNREFSMLMPVYAAGRTYEPKLREALRDFPIWDLWRSLSGLDGASLWIVKS